MSPYEALFKTKPIVNYMRPIGLKVHYRPLSSDHRKLEAPGRIGKLLGYHPNSLKYLIWDPEQRKVVYTDKIIPSSTLGSPSSSVSIPANNPISHSSVSSPSTFTSQSSQSSISNFALPDASPPHSDSELDSSHSNNELDTS